ncbi:hypothetical protein [Flavobacterium reichenbachii]|uniref:Uncharacterized protein n=1 Tax=Flavobacterium reichenbachii TaxID=362418 RepID=A0A085ZNV8_9FLAO|nr:hypothetical protein [Flavobacterium reichenbachii]KFF06122.1 hypothetical protein IW19_11540 [Flavobacterium reichenbachii]OXB14655.1 hypothetical protein B0A68_11410 [Flavobacterium reichenbachii]
MIKKDAFKENATFIGYRDKEFEKIIGYTLEEYVKKKSITTLELNGNEKYDDSILDRFRLEIQNIINLQDPAKGIHLKFSKKTTYENVIRSFQICKEERCPTYVPDGYDFWVFPYYKKRHYEQR